MANITILGCGFGTALAVMLDKCGHNVTAWTKYQNEIDDILRNGEHKRLLPGVPVPPSISFTTDPSCVKGADLIITAIPSRFLGDALEQVKPFVEKKSAILNVGKGFVEESKKRLSELICEVFPENDVAVMAGPCHAEEVGRLIPTTVVVASKNTACAEKIQDYMQSKAFRVYVNEDVAGCELGGALKNPIALCCGILKGMHLGDNTAAALMTRGLAEITRLAVALGAKWETFAGLAGVGDLIVTCTSMHSRNYRAGLLIGEGMSAAEAVAQVGTVEGYGCAKIAYELAKEHNVSVPIIEQLNLVCYGDAKLNECVSALMTRPKTHEKEVFWEE